MKTFKTFVDESLVRQQEKLEENYRSLAQKGIGAETKGSIKVGHGVDYYHPKNGNKHMGKIHSMSDTGYVVKDDKTGEKHSFGYFRKEEVEIDEGLLDVAKSAVKTVAKHAGNAAKSTAKSAAKHAAGAAKSAAKHAAGAAKSAAVGFVHGAKASATEHSPILKHAGRRLHSAVKKKFGEDVEPESTKKAYATIKAKMKNEEHQDILMALYDELSEENQETFEAMLDSNPEKLLAFAQSHFASE